ncbi:Glutamyl-tRNA(Gln) amidotransferase subunit B, mitochondrial [Holothuria leucospilota]|uniref:Glutamyl-tRNA(Gln) amidotransferase subunit B, mitochondrial n=1 Tax=Holothuria leucospilota TaxID=206669 RepID=A0A9Q1BL08_HOLLE|nr:Glutamyl-tRNA(Gln) amidotransferase subunit B, mitochondrial [Holothuria leucospilota]
MLFDKDSRSVSEIMAQEDLQQINSPEEVMKLCKEVMDEELDMVELYRTNKKVINRLMGSIQKKTKGRVDPKMARKIMEDLLER